MDYSGEYFEISLISKNIIDSLSSKMDCLRKLGLTEGKNQTDFFEGKQILVAFIGTNDEDYDELLISLPDQYFHKDSFKDELNVITNFVNKCFEYNEDIEYALCSYEMNGYILSSVYHFKDLKDEVLKKFPVVYKKNINSIFPNLEINLDAQDIFV